MLKIITITVVSSYCKYQIEVKKKKEEEEEDRVVHRQQLRYTCLYITRRAAHPFVHAYTCIETITQLMWDPIEM